MIFQKIRQRLSSRHALSRRQVRTYSRWWPDYRSEAVRIANGVVDSVVIADPVNFSQTMPI